MSDSILKIQNINFYYSDKTVLKDFSMTIQEGTKLVISGPNGCGKTTLLKCIAGLLQPADGTIIKSDNLNIAYCKQNYPDSRFPVSAEEVVAMGTRNKAEVEKAMAETDTLRFKNRSFYSLSGGEKQRVSLARCFCQKANLLLFDEPSSYLDSQSRQAFVQTMFRLPDTIAAIVVTHDRELVKELKWEVLKMEEKQ